MNKVDWSSNIKYLFSVFKSENWMPKYCGFETDI